VLPAIVAALVVFGLGAGAPAAPAATPASPPAADQPRIVEVYPNPTVTGDEGEFVTLRLPPGTPVEEYAIAEEHATVPLATASNVTGPRPRPGNVTGPRPPPDNVTGPRPPPGNVTGPRPPPDSPRVVTFSTHPDRTTRLIDRRVGVLDDRLQLANGGDRVRLLRDGRTVDEVRYDRAPEGEVYDATTGRWRPLGATDRPIVSTEGGTVEAFVLPDQPDRAIELLESAENRILLAGYTLTSRRVVDALRAAHRQGVTVEVLVDASPVEGIPERSITALDELDRSGVRVKVSGGERARYRFYHAKYAIVDDRALVTTENWKPAGTGGKSSRGWAVLTAQDRIVDGLVETYRADSGWLDAIRWREFEGKESVEETRSRGEYPTQFEARSVPVERTSLLVAPDNAEGALVDLIDGAEESIDIKQVGIGDPSFPLLQAVLDAAKRGVEVRILLSGAWYVREENEQLAAWLDEQASAGDLPVEVRLAEPNGAFEKIHAKGILVDGDQVAFGSANWNRNSLRNNREVLLLLEGEAIAGYFGAVFESDWGDGGFRFPIGLGLACALAALLAAIVAARIRFETRSRRRSESAG